jgi:chlorite dismutase
MRLAIFVSLALASSVASFAASACDTRDDYSNKINKFQAEYQAAVNQANNAYVEKTMYSVRSRDADLVDWSNSVNTALGSYTKNVQETYDNYMYNACVWW